MGLPHPSPSPREWRSRAPPAFPSCSKTAKAAHTHCLHRTSTSSSLLVGRVCSWYSSQHAILLVAARRLRAPACRTSWRSSAPSASRTAPRASSRRPSTLGCCVATRPCARPSTSAAQPCPRLWASMRPRRRRQRSAPPTPRHTPRTLQGLPPAACRLPPAACRLPPAASRLPPAASCQRECPCPARSPPCPRRLLSLPPSPATVRAAAARG